MGEGLLQILLAIVIIVIVFKIAKNIAKKLFFLIIAIAAIVFLKGIIDWAMIESVGLSLFEWLQIKLASSCFMSPVLFF